MTARPTCPKVLIGLGYPCGRPVDVAAGLGLCAFHTDESLGVRRPAGPERAAKPNPAPRPPCACGSTDFYAVGMCRSCYQHDRWLQRKAAAQRTGKSVRAEEKEKLERFCSSCGAPKVFMGGECQRCWRETCHQRRRAAWRSENTTRAAEMRA